MNISVALDFRFTQTPDGRVWTRTTYARPFWERYLAVFDHVKVIARAEPKAEVSREYRLVTGNGVSFAAVPYYLGPMQYLKMRHRVRSAVRTATGEQDAVLCRVGSRLASDLIPWLWQQGRPYGLEVVGDPMEAFSPGAIRHALRPVFRAVATRSLKQQCARASAVSYVTEFSLQRRYPAGRDRLSIAVSDAELSSLFFADTPRTFVTHASSTDLDDTAFAESPKLHKATSRPRIVFIGSLEQMYKAPDVLLEAISVLNGMGTRVELSLIGAGRHREELQQLAEKLHISNQVTFYGEVPAGEAIRKQLDSATLFVLPSRTEGLPRVLVEAMARALPCVATRVGGIPELLADEDLVPANDSKALAGKIAEVLRSQERMNRMSVRNLRKAQEFRPELLQQRRTEFYRFLRDATQAWLTRRVPEVA